MLNYSLFLSTFPAFVPPSPSQPFLLGALPLWGLVGCRSVELVALWQSITYPLHPSAPVPLHLLNPPAQHPNIFLLGDDGILQGLGCSSHSAQPYREASRVRDTGGSLQLLAHLCCAKCSQAPRFFPLSCLYLPFILGLFSLSCF